MLSDEYLKGYQSQGEWFSVMAGPEQHVNFIKDLLAVFYIERFRNKSLWTVQLEWIISPDQSRVSEIPNADKNVLCGSEEGKGYGLEDATQPHEEELALRARAEEQAVALGRIIYPELDQ